MYQVYNRLRIPPAGKILHVCLSDIHDNIPEMVSRLACLVSSRTFRMEVSGVFYVQRVGRLAALRSDRTTAEYNTQTLVGTREKLVQKE